MKEKYFVQGKDGELTLRECVECLALDIGREMFLKRERVEDIYYKCKILDSLSNALNTINS